MSCRVMSLMWTMKLTSRYDLHLGRRADIRCRCEMISLENQLQSRAMSILVVLTVAYYHGNLGFSIDLHLGSFYETALTKSPK